MSNQKRKGAAPPRYDDAFKEGAIRMVVELKRPQREVAAELGICVDTLKSWLKKANHTPHSSGNRTKELETEIRTLKKALADREETIEILKKAAGIFLKP